MSTPDLSLPNHGTFLIDASSSGLIRSPRNMTTSLTHHTNALPAEVPAPYYVAAAKTRPDPEL